MKRSTKIILVILFIVFALFGLYRFMLYKTKQISPEETVTFKNGKALIEITYSRPSKKGRQIFDSLVPYGKVWRTGANEPTIIYTSSALKFKGEVLPAGKYTLWTIPEKDQWKVIINKKQYSWGINFNGEATREAGEDFFSVTAPVEATEQIVEKFTISIEENPNIYLVMRWDHTAVKVPIEILD